MWSLKQRSTPLLALLYAALASAADSSATSSSVSSQKATFTAGIPNNDLNPFIDQSHVPEGTLFIAFGSVLGGLFLAVVIWRITSLVNMRRAAKKSDAKFMALTQQNYGGPFFDPITEDEAAMEKRRADTTRANLYFSPIKEVMKTGSLVAPISASPSYLPSGYYAAGDSSRLSGRPYSMTREGGLSRVSLDPSNAYESASIAEHSQSSSHGSGPSGGASGSLAPSGPLSGSHLAPAPSSTSGMAKGRKQRPPSAYLDELIAQ